jgi:hypothetical protein
MAPVRRTLLKLVKDWNTDPHRAAQQPLHTIGEKHRTSTAAHSPAEQPRTLLARKAKAIPRSDPAERAESGKMINSRSKAIATDGSSIDTGQAAESATSQLNRRST